MNSEEREAYEEHFKWLRIEAKGRVEGDTRKTKNIALDMLKAFYYPQVFI